MHIIMQNAPGQMSRRARVAKFHAVTSKPGAAVSLEACRPENSVGPVHGARRGALCVVESAIHTRSDGYLMIALALAFATAGAAPPPPPYFGCPSDSCLKVTFPRPADGDDDDYDASSSASCSDSVRRSALARYATDYEAAGTDEGGRTHFRSRHHAALYLYFTHPTSRYSPAEFAQWQFSTQRSNQVVIGDSRAMPPDLTLRVGDDSTLRKAPPLGAHAWSHSLGRPSAACRADVRIECALCSGVAASSRALEPSPTRVGCRSLGLQWATPAPPYWGLGTPPPERYKLSVEVPPLGSARANRL